MSTEVASTEFREIPKNSVSVYTHVPNEDTPLIIRDGLLVKRNRRIALYPEIERIFSEESRHGRARIDRSKCVFAFPDLHYMTHDPLRERIVESWVNPKKVWVADYDLFTQAAGNDSYTIEQKRELARMYWERTMRLSDFLNRGSPQIDIPEVLIPFNIPPQKIRLI